MREQEGRYIIRELQKKWTATLLLTHWVLVFAITIFVSAIAVSVLHVSLFFIPFAFLLSSSLVFFFRYKKLTEKDVSGFLNSHFPALQESTGLLLQSYEQLNFLEKLQVQRIERALAGDIRQPRNLAHKLSRALLLLLAACVVGLALYLFPANLQKNKTSATGSGNTRIISETKLPEVEEVRIRITPPGYTGKKTREQDRFNVIAEEAGSLTWDITTTAPVQEMQLVFNDKSVMSLQAADKEHTHWIARKQVNNSGFYQVKIGPALSELYKMEMIKDQPPVITVQSPKPNTIIAPWEQQLTQLAVSLSDDYGIKKTFISATISSGSGEAVRFREQLLLFGNFIAGSNKYQLQKQIDLRSLGMKPGDELYFYVSATDTYDQEKRSDIYIVKIEDTTQLMSLEGLASGVNIKPEFFRSQRQIIIETEQLLKDKDKMSAEAFNQRSNDLGVDQKLLRLRYGKFLGEETNAEIGGEHAHEEEEAGAVVLGNAQQMMDEVAHKHDIAEDATFFDAQTKKQLKATLAEMWKAELQLRTYKPKEALPFEYAALKLLKELQQQTRVYVAKTGIRTTPLKPEKRLTGELDKIIQQVQQQNFLQATDEPMIQRKALGILEQLRNGEPADAQAMDLLTQAGMQLNIQAAAEPAAYLPALEAYRRILQKKQRPADITLAGNALQRMIKMAARRPHASYTNPDGQLSRRYFMNLNRGND